MEQNLSIQQDSAPLSKHDMALSDAQGSLHGPGHSRTLSRTSSTSLSVMSDDDSVPGLSPSPSFISLASTEDDATSEPVTPTAAVLNIRSDESVDDKSSSTALYALAYAEMCAKMANEASLCSDVNAAAHTSSTGAGYLPSTHDYGPPLSAYGGTSSFATSMGYFASPTGYSTPCTYSAESFQYPASSLFADPDAQYSTGFRQSPATYAPLPMQPDYSIHAWQSVEQLSRDRVCPAAPAPSAARISRSISRTILADDGIAASSTGNEDEEEDEIDEDQSLRMLQLKRNARAARIVENLPSDLRSNVQSWSTSFERSTVQTTSKYSEEFEEGFVWMKRAPVASEAVQRRALRAAYIIKEQTAPAPSGAPLDVSSIHGQVLAGIDCGLRSLLFVDKVASNPAWQRRQREKNALKSMLQSTISADSFRQTS